VANLLLARANSRAREVAVRAAVGAGRARLIQQFLVESVVLGVAGGVAGLAVAYWAIRALVALGPSRIPRLAEVGVDWRVLMFVVAVAVATSVVFGLVPALATTGRSFARLVSTAGRGLVGEAGTRVRRTLVVAEMALAVILLVAAGLLMRSYQRISNVDPGFSPDHVLTFSIGLPESKYKTSAAAGGFVQAFVDGLAARPGVEAAAGVFGLPLDDNFSASSSFTRPGETDSADSPSVGMRIVTPDYFKALRIPLRAGRLFDGHDDEAGAEVVVINEEAARRYWPGMNPIGQQLHLGVRLAWWATSNGPVSTPRRHLRCISRTSSMRWTRSPSSCGPRASRPRSFRSPGRIWRLSIANSPSRRFARWTKSSADRSSNGDS
jgi:predicted permease